MSDQGPRYYAVNDRPVALVPTADGGLDALVFDFATGALTPDRRYFSRTVDVGVGKDVDALSAAEFAAAVERLRRELLTRYAETPLLWTADGAGGALCTMGERQLAVRAGTDTSTWTLVVDGHELGELPAWPPAWRRVPT